ncbi:MAG: Hpt domain-containing protein [Deltaproteobacteria bacterium]|nr:Hpt domain-containing protein [Deltaproteobacteria bacterium]
MEMSHYRDLFVSEARSHLSAFSELIAHLEESTGDSASINELFRHTHSLKGMAAVMGYEQIAGIAYTMEDQLGRVRNGELLLSPALADLLLEGCDALTRQVSLVETGISSAEDTSDLIKRLAAYTPSAVFHPHPQDSRPQV